MPDPKRNPAVGSGGAPTSSNRRERHHEDTARLRHDPETDVIAALAGATIYELARALDESAFTGDKHPDRFACPDCRAWTAEVLDSWRWWCPCWPSTTTTDAQRTKLALRQHVAARFDACRRLVEMRSATPSERARARSGRSVA